MYLDENIAYQKSFKPDPNATSFCGYIDYGEEIVEIDVTKLHGYETIEIFFTSNLD